MTTFQEIFEKLKELEEILKQQKFALPEEKREIEKLIRDLENELYIKALDPLVQINVPMIDGYKDLDDLISKVKSDTESQYNKAIALREIIKIIKKIKDYI